MRELLRSTAMSEILYSPSCLKHSSLTARSCKFINFPNQVVNSCYHCIIAPREISIGKNAIEQGGKRTKIGGKNASKSLKRLAGVFSRFFQIPCRQPNFNPGSLNGHLDSAQVSHQAKDVTNLCVEIPTSQLSTARSWLICLQV